MCLLGSVTMRNVPMAMMTPPTMIAVLNRWPCEMTRLLALVGQGAIASVHQTYPLADALTATDDLRNGRVMGRAVLIP
jgi:D-arabinose 1-dehydrogenase-like Zn-dependent alcohol dehydrogenase